MLSGPLLITGGAPKRGRDISMGGHGLGVGGCKVEGGAGVVVSAPSPISPLKAALELSVIHSMAGAQCRAPETSPNPHPPTFACDPYNNTPVIATGRQTSRSKPPLRMRQTGLLFFISDSGKVN